MTNMVRQLPSLTQIALALQHRGFQVRQQGESLLVHQAGEGQPRLQLRYLEPLFANSPNQLLEMRVPLLLTPDPVQLKEIAGLLASLNGNLKGLALVFAKEGLALRSCQLHPRQGPDLKNLLNQIHKALFFRKYLNSLLTPYLQGKTSYVQLQEHCQ